MLQRIAVFDMNAAEVSALEEQLQTTQPPVTATTATSQAGAAKSTAMIGILAASKTIDTIMPTLHQIAQERINTLVLLSDAVDCREGITAGSSNRVREHATRFAHALGLSNDERIVLEHGALLRDIGKITIPNEVLLKNSPLTYDEWILIQHHTLRGVELLNERGICQEISDILLRHHECYDGDGYPDHLEGDAIPYFARIIKILDVYCAMTGQRHYRKTKCSHEEALEYLKSERGKHFDPELIDTFVREEIGETIL